MLDQQSGDILERITDEFFAFDREWRFTYINDRALYSLQRIKGKELTREELLGKNARELFPEGEGSGFYQKFREAMGEQKTVQFEAYSTVTDGWFEVHAYPSEEGLTAYVQDITDRKQAEEELETRVRQHAVVAELGLQALSNKGLQSLMDEAVVWVSRTLGVEYCKIVVLLPGGQELLMRAGVGWDDGLVGRATEEAGLDSQAGYTLLVSEPVILEDLSTETRFRPSWLVREHGAVSGISVVILDRDEPFGVLSAYTTEHGTFSEADVDFLPAVADVLATAIEREAEEERLEEVREVERSRMARGLHDEVLQDLAGAMAEAQLARVDVRRRLEEKPELAERLGQLSEALGRVERQVRAAIYDLGLEGEQERPFSELLKVLMELQRSMATELDISLDLSDGVLDDPLGKEGRELLCIIGEALTNARRHSGVRSVQVSVTTHEGKLIAEVKDDGLGIEVAEEPSATSTGGVGVRGMRERAWNLGGDLEIESEPGQGTRVRFEMALEKDREEEPEEEAVRILLVEDHATVRDAVASSFEGEAGFEVVAQAESLSEARGMLEGIDVAVVDLGLPDGYGGDLIKDLREANPRAQAIVLSASLDRGQIARAVEAGAAGMLHKSAHLDEVVDSVRRLSAGETLMPLEEVVELLRYASTRREEEYEARQAMETLTPREIEVLQALTEGLDSKGIAERLHISLRTERNHMASILSKLEVHSQLQALVFSVRHGVVEIP